MRTVILLLAVIFQILISCSQQKEVRSKEDMIEKWINQEFLLPDSLQFFYSGQAQDTALTDYFTDRCKIISIIENDCRNCTISQLMFWDSFKSEYIDLYDIQLVLIYCDSGDYLENVLLDELGVNLPVLFDPDNTLFKIELFSDPLYRTILLDTENKVKLIGDFRDNKQLEELYLEQIRKCQFPN